MCSSLSTFRVPQCALPRMLCILGSVGEKLVQKSFPVVPFSLSLLCQAPWGSLAELTSLGLY